MKPGVLPDSRQNTAAKDWSGLLEFALAVRETEIEPDLDDLVRLSSVEGVDAGEAVLFAVPRNLDDFILFIVATGGKRALKALKDEASCNSIFRRLSATGDLLIQ